MQQYSPSQLQESDNSNSRYSLAIVRIKKPLRHPVPKLLSVPFFTLRERRNRSTVSADGYRGFKLAYFQKKYCYLNELPVQLQIVSDYNNENGSSGKRCNY